MYPSEQLGDQGPAPQDARERLLSTAYRLSIRSTPTATMPWRRNVAEAGVAKTTLYRHFRSKDDLPTLARPHT